MTRIRPNQKQNLIKLANGLINDHNRKTRFNMGTYAEMSDDWDIYGMKRTECGAVGCAVGHAPFYGIKKELGESWTDYSNRTLIQHYNCDDAEWRWCFTGSWKDTDNTKIGAAQRIIWLLQYGLPDDWGAQLRGDAALCYTGVTGFCEKWLSGNIN